MSRHQLTDAGWRRLAPLLLLQRPGTGRPARDHRTIINAMLWLTRTGAPARPAGTLWALADGDDALLPLDEERARQRLLAELQREGDAAGRLDWSVHMVDGTNIRAHRHAAGAKGGTKARRSAAHPLGRLDGRSCADGDRLLPIWLRQQAPSPLRADGRPIAFVHPSGERHEQSAFQPLMAAGTVRRSRPWPAAPRPHALRPIVATPAGAFANTSVSAASPPSSRSWRPRSGPPDRLAHHRECNVAERPVGRLKSTAISPPLTTTRQLLPRLIHLAANLITAFPKQDRRHATRRFDGRPHGQ